MPIIVNLGSGKDEYGSVRIDLEKRKPVNLVADLEVSIPLKDSSVDLVYSAFLFEHLRNPGFFLLEAKRILKTGGKNNIKD
jgi:predicted SAM-dependent methyltransferase